MEVGYADAVYYGFDIAEDEWNANYRMAKGIVDRIVGLNEVSDEEAYAMAVCAACERLSDGGLGDSPSMTIGGFSIGATTGSKESARMAALEFLAPAGLAFLGV